MKAFIISLFKFVGFALCFVAVGIFLWAEVVPLHRQQNILFVPGSGGHLRSKIAEIEAYGPTDVVVLGSSHALTGFDPRIFQEEGIRIFNLGSASQTPIQTELMVDRYIDQLNPKLVIYEVYPGVFGADGVESALHFIANDRIGTDTLKMALNINNLSVYGTFVYGLWRQALGLDANYVEERIKHGTTYVSGGYVERPVHFFEGDSNNRERTWNLRDGQKRAFERTVNTLRTKGIKVILVQAPITRELYESFSNNDEVDAYFAGTALQYYNLNHQLDLSSRLHFFDSNHLNQDGVTIMNSMVIKLLLSDGE